MEKKKIFIISYNNLPIDFWKAHLNFENAQVWHWQNSEQAISNLTTVWPDIIIVDGYWAKKSFQPCIESILSKKMKIKLFCFIPLDKSNTKLIHIDQRMTVSNFNSDVLEKINELIKSNDLNQIISRTA